MNSKQQMMLSTGSKTSGTTRSYTVDEGRDEEGQMMQPISKPTETIESNVVIEARDDGSRKAKRRRSSASTEIRKSILPEGFSISSYSVVFGRGKRCSENVGNRRLQVIASMNVGRYASANSKLEKSHIVTDIMDTVREACPERRGAFVKYFEGRWWEVNENFVRERIGSILRDCLHTKYKSSTRAKLEKRRFLIACAAAEESRQKERSSLSKQRESNEQQANEGLIEWDVTFDLDESQTEVMTDDEMSMSHVFD